MAREPIRVDLFLQNVLNVVSSGFHSCEFVLLRESAPAKAQNSAYVPPSDEDWFDPRKKEIQWKKINNGESDYFVVAVFSKKKENVKHN